MKRQPGRVGAARLLVAGSALLALPWALAGQGSVHAATLDVDFTAPPGGARVRIVYELNGVAPGDLVPVSVLDFGQARAHGFRVGADGSSAQLPDSFGAARAGAWRVEEASRGRSVLQVEYEVPRVAEDGTGRSVSHVPLLTVGLAPEAARPGLFQARVRVPGDWVVTEGFPTNLAAGDEAGVFTAELAVVPSVVTVRARVDGRGAVSLPLMLDLLALAVLVVTAVVGWRHMREPMEPLA